MTPVSRRAIGIALSAAPLQTRVAHAQITAPRSTADAISRDSAARDAPSAGRRIITAVAIAHAPHLAGRLDDPAWATADSITDFRQREPVEGAPATERTVVKLLRGPDALYVGVRAADRAPALLRATQLRRDADLTVDDYVTVLIDSFHERRGGFLFRTNPNGAMWDAELTGFDAVNADWNGIWEVATARDSAGWTAEFRIPFRTLRFRPGDAMIGINVQRVIRRKNEETLWRSFGRTQGLTNLLDEGEVTGFGNVGRGRSVELRPYALTRLVETPHDATGVTTGTGSVGGKVGLDAKAALAPTVTGDFTINTDFAQVEADSQIVNLTRFPLFFPEKREFFLESSGLFDFGTPGRAQLFYSRRIGLDTTGTTVPILAGARVYGKTGPWAFGLIDTRTGAREQANDAVLRVKHDLFARSYLGAMASQQSGPGVTGHAQTAGVDADFPLVVGGHNVEPSVWLMGTRTPAVRGTPVAWRVATDYPNDLFDNFVSLYRIDPGFAPALGFVRRTGIWETTGHVDYLPRPGVLGIRQLDFEFPIPSWDIIADATGTAATLADVRRWQSASFTWQLLGGTLQSGDQFAATVQRTLDAPTQPFAIFRDVQILPGRYWWTRGQLQYTTSPGRPLSVGSQLSGGPFYDGHDTELSASATLRGGGHLILGANVDRSDVHLRTHHFTALQTAGRVEYAFTTRSDVLAFVQYTNEERRVDVNVRVHWIPVIGDDVYLVWNSGYTADPQARFRFPSRGALGRPLNGALIVKAVHRLAL